jgi:hypothetical protein
MEKIRWTDRVRNEEVLHKIAKERNILHTAKRSKANWIGRSLRENCLLRHIIKGKIKGGIEVTGKRGRRDTKLLEEMSESIKALQFRFRLWENDLNAHNLFHFLHLKSIQNCFS